MPEPGVQIMRNLIKWAFLNEVPMRLVMTSAGVKGFVAVRHPNDLPRLKKLIYAAVESTVAYEFHCRSVVTTHNRRTSQQEGGPIGIP